MNDTQKPQALIVVDMQRDFVDPEGKLTLNYDTSDLIGGISDLIKNFKGKIFYTLDSHGIDSCEFKSFPKHCIEGTEGHRLTAKVAKAIYDREIQSHRRAHELSKYSFTDNDIIKFLLKRDTNTEYTIVGVCTHICVHDIAANLVNTAKNLRNQIPKIKIIKDLTGDFDPEMARFALLRLERLYGVEVV